MVQDPELEVAHKRLRDLLELSVLLDKAPLELGGSTSFAKRMQVQDLVRKRIESALDAYVAASREQTTAP